MGADLHAIRDALAALNDAELQAPVEATYKVPQIAPGLLAWLDSACEWELSRRAGKDYELQPPEEDAVSIDVAIAMRRRSLTMRQPRSRCSIRWLSC